MTVWCKLTSALLLTGIVAGQTAMDAIPAASEPDNRNLRRRPTVCTEQYAPVCGEKNGVTKTYSNACFAAAEGAKVIARGPCK
jgi:hypothetical protein